MTTSETEDHAANRQNGHHPKHNGHVKTRSNFHFQSVSISSTSSTITTETTTTLSTSTGTSSSGIHWTTIEHLVHGGVLVLIMLHILVAPYTKVEESFNLQATHDILNFGVSRESIQKYDHLEFPGVVPRTFVGPLLLAIGSWPLMVVARFVAPESGIPKGLLGQIIIRSVLGLFTFMGWRQMSRGIRHQFGRTVSLLFMAVSSVQFHWLFYAGRTLPNTFALAIVNVAYSYWMQASVQKSRFGVEQKLMRMIDCLVLSTVLFRSEVLILLGPIVLLELIMTRIRFWRTVQEGILAGLVSLGIAVAVDSWFWQQWMWAEGAVFWFNAVEGKSVAWGVSPWYTYFSILLPKISGLALPLALAAVLVEQRYRRYILATGVFVGLYSFLGHKEWRFIVYVVPILNLGGAITLSWIMKRKTLVYRLLALFILGGLGLNFLSSVAQALISSLNYPGGHALQRLHELELPYFPAATVHIDGAAAETGCSRFGEIGSSTTALRKNPYPWTYSKNESHRTPKDYLQYTHLLTAAPEFHQHDFEILEKVDGYVGIERVPLAQIKKTCPEALRTGFTNADNSSWTMALVKEQVQKMWTDCSPLQIRMEDRIWILKRIGAV
ncbi:dolichyl-P-Man:Man(7)GlcNAc(2)-PP-dolichol alpha-1,6-mannosyltransferase [Haplosporangium sp. Z 767]|nr:dolichyl-P-Man:Man(7)GlcNAc(2)-PP-dolichol alpha-1,6-mannosyltransferase [Haplosporangium sp. Z 767]KAF9195910.1 dolichyl-P-Man:Man(7)GlcNAc(2)-PP-dolichol alpha-1,6-mannosyltransferase [Haplosporangium sp. Z 11]